MGLKENEVLVLCLENMYERDEDDFKYPKSGIVTFNETSEEYGWLWGECDHVDIHCAFNSNYIILKVKEGNINNLGKIVKFSEGEVMLNTTDNEEVVEFIHQYKPNARCNYFSVNIFDNVPQLKPTLLGKNSSVISGHCSNIIASDGCEVCVGYHSSVLVGSNSLLSILNDCFIKSGKNTKVKYCWNIYDEDKKFVSNSEYHVFGKDLEINTWYHFNDGKITLLENKQ